MNATICWDYLLLGQHLARLLPEQQAATLATRSLFAMLSCRHLNLHGEYDFSDQPLPAEAPVNRDLITTRQPPAKPVRVESAVFPWLFSNTQVSTASLPVLRQSPHSDYSTLTRCTGSLATAVPWASWAISCSR
jgi:hypothetical protein